MTVIPGYVPGFVCTLKTCSVKQWGFIHYRPSMPGNVLFLVIFGGIGLAQLFLGIKYRTGIVCISMLLGLDLEFLGYIARVLMNGDPFYRPYFLWYLICLTTGPAFLAAAIYLCLGRIVMVYGEEISRIRARSYTVFFFGCDILSLVIQAGGGGIAASVPLTNTYMINLGTHVLVAGLSLQVASLFAFSCCSLEFLYRVHTRKVPLNPRHADIYNSRRFNWFLICASPQSISVTPLLIIASTALGTATTCLFIRTVFRSVELSGGFGGKQANSQVQFMVLDGTMVIIACTCMTVLHPGIGFVGKWAEAKFPFGKAVPHADQETGDNVLSEEKIVPNTKEGEQATADTTELNESI